ncbi:MAG TPA: hypothetical protein VFQ76_04300 [Longimicrobiaceae bacterium]|nr:hypothetical protein [Longimicrobiaceae bacterium]
MRVIEPVWAVDLALEVLAESRCIRGWEGRRGRIRYAGVPRQQVTAVVWQWEKVGLSPSPLPLIETAERGGPRTQEGHAAGEGAREGEPAALKGAMGGPDG